MPLLNFNYYGYIVTHHLPMSDLVILKVINSNLYSNKTLYPTHLLRWKYNRFLASLDQVPWGISFQFGT